MAHHPHSAGPPPLDHATLTPRSHHHHSSHHHPPPPPPQHAAPPPNGVPPHLPPPPSSHTPRHAHPPPPPPPAGGPPPQQPPPPPAAAANGSGPMQVSPATSHHRPPTAGARPSSVRGGAGARSGFTSTSLQRLAQANEETWILIGNLAEQMNDPDRAENAYENALRHNPESERALTQVASIARSRDDFGKAIEFFQRALDVRQENGEVWSALGHCYLMQDDLQKAYAAYQQALYHLPNPKDPKLWYGIGILYDRYGSLDNAEEAFSSVLRMDANFEKAEEILFRLGIIYKQQQKYPESLECFDRILRNPPAPLANLDIWFQIGHVYEQAKNYEQAKEAYERVLSDSPNHAKVLQQLGWLYHQPGSSFVNQDMAIQCLTKSLEADSGDAQSWYLLGRAYMAVQKYQKAYEAYQQAVYRDGRNPTFWCSIGVLYYNINQYRDALDAYSRAIRINPYIPEVWFDLGSLYESCNNQISDAIDAYARAADLDQNNQVIKSRLRLLKDVQANGGTMPAAPGPQDVHPTAYASGHGPPSMLMGGGSGGSSSQPGGGQPPQPPPIPHAHSRSNSRSRPSNGVDHPMNGGATRDLPAPSPSMRGGRRSAEYGRHPADEPFHGGAPPPLNIDDSAARRGSGGHAPLAPMDLDRREDSRRYPEGRDRSTNGPPPPPLHHPVPQPPIHGISEMAPPPPSGRDALPSMNSRAPYDHEGSSTRGRRSPPEESPRTGNRRPAMSPPPTTPYGHQPAPYSRSGSNYPHTPQGLPPPISSAHHGLPYDRGTATSTAGNERHDPPWERRHARGDSRNGMLDQPREFRSPAPPANGAPSSSAAYPPSHAARPPSSHSYDRRVASPHVSRSEYPERRDDRSPPYPPPPSSYWGSQHSPPQGHPAPRRSSPPPAPPSSAPPRRYDPRYDEPSRREGWERDRDVTASRHSEGPPPPLQQQQPPPLHHHHATSERVDRSYNGTPELGSKSNGVPPSSMSKPPPLESAPRNAWGRSESPPGSGRATVEPPKERKKRGGGKDKDDAGTPKPMKEKKERKQPSKRGAGMKQGLVEQESDRSSVAPMPDLQQHPPPPPFKAPSVHKTLSSSPQSQWATHSHSGTATPSVHPPHVHRPNRSVDEDYDEEGTEREDGHGGAAAALMGLAAGNGRPAPPPPARSVSNSRLESLLNGGSGGPPTRSPTIPSRGPVDRVRSPAPGRSGTPLKRGPSSDDTIESERKRSRIDSNTSSSSTNSPPVPSKLNAILSPTDSSSRVPPFSNSQSRRASLDTRSDTHSRRSWAEVEHERKVSSTSPSQSKPRSTPISPNPLPPIATLDTPSSPSASKGPARPGSPMHVDGPRVPSPVGESA